MLWDQNPLPYRLATSQREKYCITYGLAKASLENRENFQPR